MTTIALFDLAARRAEWLSLRSEAVAENVANVNTPGYAAKEVASFESVLERTGLSLAVTNSAHLPETSAGARVSGGFRISGETAGTGNAVSLEEELIKSGANARDYALTSAIEKAFHRMLLLSAKG
jgi:flagellar basal-body rod protein FlgB